MSKTELQRWEEELKFCNLMMLRYEKQGGDLEDPFYKYMQSARDLCLRYIAEEKEDHDGAMYLPDPS